MFTSFYDVRRLIPSGPEPNLTNLSIIKVQTWKKHYPKGKGTKSKAN